MVHVSAAAGECPRDQGRYQAGLLRTVSTTCPATRGGWPAGATGTGAAAGTCD